MINMEDLKPILEPLLEGNENSASIIEQVSAIDKDVETDTSAVDKVNADWNERFKKAFFGEKADNTNETIPQYKGNNEPKTDPGTDSEERLTYDNLFQKEKEDE